MIQTIFTTCAFWKSSDFFPSYPDVSPLFQRGIKIPEWQNRKQERRYGERLSTALSISDTMIAGSILCASPYTNGCENERFPRILVMKGLGVLWQNPLCHVTAAWLVISSQIPTCSLFESITFCPEQNTNKQRRINHHDNSTQLAS